MKHVHLVGVGGVGMVSLAGLFIQAGWRVSGCDHQVYPPASEELKRLNIQVMDGFDPNHLRKPIDLIVVGNVVSRSNPMVDAIESGNVPYTSMAQALSDYFLAQRQAIVIAGTHGKTTTTAMMAGLLEAAGRDPGLFVGGIAMQWNQGYLLGQGPYFVVEGDEYDTAYFDKTPKFLHYRPSYVVLNNIEFDHADIYPDLDSIEQQFAALVQLVPQHGAIVANGEDERVSRLTQRLAPKLTELWSLRPGQAAWYADHLEHRADGSTEFDVVYRQHKEIRVTLPLLGRHNVSNALACYVLARKLGVSAQQCSQGLSQFAGVRRRQQRIGEERGVLIFDDFAHHPSAVATTLAGLLPIKAARGGRLWAVFEPRSNTSRRNIFQDQWPQSFAAADYVLLAPVFKKQDQLAQAQQLNIEELLHQLNQGATLDPSTHCPRAACLSDDDMLNAMVQQTRANDIVVFMSNGDFRKLPERLFQVLKT